MTLFLCDAYFQCSSARRCATGRCGAPARYAKKTDHGLLRHAMTDRQRFSLILRIEDQIPDACAYLADQSGLAKARIKDAMNKGAVWHTARGKRRELRRATPALARGDTLELHYAAALLALRPPPARCADARRRYRRWRCTASIARPPAWCWSRTMATQPHACPRCSATTPSKSAIGCRCEVNRRRTPARSRRRSTPSPRSRITGWRPTMRPATARRWQCASAPDVCTRSAATSTCWAARCWATRATAPATKTQRACNCRRWGCASSARSAEGKEPMTRVRTWMICGPSRRNALHEIVTPLLTRRHGGRV